MDDFVQQVGDGDEHRFEYSNDVNELMDHVLQVLRVDDCTSHAEEVSTCIGRMLSLVKDPLPAAQGIMNILDIWPPLHTAVTKWISLADIADGRRDADGKFLTIKGLLQSKAAADAKVKTAASVESPVATAFDELMHQVQENIDEASNTFVAKALADLGIARAKLLPLSKGAPSGGRWSGEADAQTMTFDDIVAKSKETLLKLNGGDLSNCVKDFRSALDHMNMLRTMFDLSPADMQGFDEASDEDILASAQATKYTALLVVLLAGIRDNNAVPQKTKRQLRNIRKELSNMVTVEPLMPPALLERAAAAVSK